MDSAHPQDARRPRRAGLATRGRLVALLAASIAAAPLAIAEVPDWRTEAPFAAVDRAIEAWLAEAAVDPERAASDWRGAVAEAPRAARLGPAIRALAGLVEERLASPASDEPPEWLEDAGLVSASLRLAFAEDLMSHQRYDAGLAWLEGVNEDEAYSPVLLWYQRAVAAQQLVEDQTAREALERLDSLLADRPGERLGKARLWVVERLGRELGAEADPLASVARRMVDAERRLALSDPSESTRDGQQTILDELDKLIEDLEKQRQQQQQQQQAAAGGSGGSAEPGMPAEESRPSELKGPGLVDRKRLVAGDAWGALPPAERERLTQAITRDYPPHYRALVEDYFRTLASEADQAAAPNAGASSSNR